MKKKFWISNKRGSKWLYFSWWDEIHTKKDEIYDVKNIVEKEISNLYHWDWMDSNK